MRSLGSVRYLALIGVVFGVLASLSAFVWGGWRAVLVALHVVQGNHAIVVELVQVMDGFLIASGLLIFSVGIYELFIGDLDVPEWLRIADLDALKSRLAGIVVLAMAVVFLERLETGENARDVFFIGAGVALVAAVLSALQLHKKS